MPRAASPRKIFAANVRTLRKRRGLSQEDLAEVADLHRTYIGSVERGERNISIDSMERMARALGTTVVALLGETIP
jgi:transcriptional regulator with XRE-family HTH domain